MSRDHASAEKRFRCLYVEHVDPIVGFAMRRADDPADAETILVAWDDRIQIDRVQRQRRPGRDPHRTHRSAGLDDDLDGSQWRTSSSGRTARPVQLIGRIRAVSDAPAAPVGHR
ncbi:hypothetical protein OHA40_30000 [Nocardia sp. NBC_00508]|uniref:hypothetical protein n=1 Tax=Nocardia sp. NBC_00508 TaxID=2975992 RepID=UPI002E81DA59|nr:hypothetical protein [Nocardia sp. NBC_00508]WUD65797.1 hypothetical protein OHA40_30000 [Nocardia sp. NBC_00508]